MKAETDIEPEYIKRMVDRATVQKIVGHLIYGTEIDVEEDDYGKRTEDAYARLEQITNGDEKLLASLMKLLQIFLTYMRNWDSEQGLFSWRIYMLGGINLEREKALIKKIADLYGFQEEKIKDPVRIEDSMQLL